MTLELSLARLMDGYATVRPKAIPTLRSIFKIVAPLAWRRLHPRGAVLEVWLSEVPAHALYGLLAFDQRAGWHANLAGKLPAGASYQKAYPRFVRRLIAYGEAEGLLHPDHHLISPAWRRIVTMLEPHVGDANVKQHTARSALRRLARWATAADIEPRDMPIVEEHGIPMAAFKATFPVERDGDFYRARRAWNLIVSGGRELELRPWPSEPASPFSALPVSRWPPLIQQAFEQLLARDDLGGWSPETRAGYRHRLGSYLGTLERLGLAPAALVAPAADGRDALRILFQGLPPGTGSGEDPVQLARHLADPAAGIGFVAALRSYEGKFEGRACEPNPLVLAVAASMAGAGYLTSARDLLLKVRAINQGLLGVTSRHTGWCARRLAILEERARRSPSAYTLKKRAVFRTPKLWLQLVAARRAMRTDTLALEAACWGAAVASPARRRWAIALRNEVLYGLLLCYPLRAKNLVEMRLGNHYDPRSHHLYFAPHETKNGKEVDYELPDGGELGDLRGLFEQYLAEARPALLAGRTSPYVFVPDPRGGIRLRSKGINAILAETSRRYLKEVLPAGVTILNPHLVRHAVATYHVAIGRDVNLAAQLLNDAPATIGQAYADVLESKKEATKVFLSAFKL